MFGFVLLAKPMSSKGLYSALGLTHDSMIVKQNLARNQCERIQLSNLYAYPFACKTSQFTWGGFVCYWELWEMNLGIFCSSPYQATCCSDQQHCCPQDTTCDIPEGKCNKKDEVLTWTTESLALLTLGNIKCDDTHYCPEGNTCCKILTGTWGCCPLPKVCLSVLITLGEFHCQWASWGVGFA